MRNNKINYNYHDKPTKHKELLNLVLGYASFLFASIIFLSYFHIYIYFQSFNIGVYNYNSPYELIFYFIPSYIITPINIILMVLNYCIYGIPLASIPAALILIDLLFLDRKCINYLLSLWKKFNHPDLKSGDFISFRKIYHRASQIYIFVCICLIVRLFYELLLFTDYTIIRYFTLLPHLIFQLMFLVWGYFVLEWIYRYFRIKKSKSMVHVSLYMLLFVIFSMMVLSSSKTAKNVYELKNGKALQNIHFEYNGKQIKTDSHYFFIGQSKDYLFLKSYNDSLKTLDSTMVYNLSEVKNLTYTNEEK
mgnify:CR=1 FL=1